MPRQRYTLAQLKDRLRERAGNNQVFWTDPELKDALNEAISVWQALTGEWTIQKNIPAISDSPSFYPVPKEIVSLTRVGTDSDVSAANPLGGTIIVEKPAFESDVTLSFYHTAWDVRVPMRFIPVGGVGPYTIVWDFDDGDTETSGLELITHTWELPAGVDQFVPTLRTITATVTDVTGDVFEATFDLTLIDPNPTIWEDALGEYTGVPYSLTIVDFNDTWVVVQGKFHTEVEYNGSAATNYAGNIYGGRYPITVEFDFQASPGENVSEESGRAPVERVELWDNTGTILIDAKDLVGGGEMRISHYMTDFSKWNNGVIRLLRGYLDGGVMRQDPDNVVSDPWGPPATSEPGIVRLWIRRGWYNLTGGMANFKVHVTDGTGKTVTKWAEYIPGALTKVSGTISCNGDCGGVLVELLDPFFNSVSTTTNVAGYYEFTDFTGLTFIDGDSFSIHGYTGSPPTCPGTGYVCPGGEVCVDDIQTFSPWAWGTFMTADVALPTTVIPCFCPPTARVDVTQTTPPLEYWFDGFVSTCADAFEWDFGDGFFDFLNGSVSHTYAPGYNGVRVYCSLLVHGSDGDDQVFFNFVVGVDTVIHAETGPGTSCCPS